MSKQKEIVVFREVKVGEYVLRFWPSDNGWMCGITSEMMQALTEQSAQQALDKKAENARELGLDYEPVCNKDPQGCWNVRCQLGKKCKNTSAQQEPMDFDSLLHEAEEIVRQKPTWKRFIDGTPLSNDIAVWMTVFAQDVARRTFPPAQQEPVAHAVIAGALFDFMGWLTSRKERLVLSSADNASPAVEAITEFAKMRGLSLNDAKVQDWNTSPSAQRKESK